MRVTYKIQGNPVFAVENSGFLKINPDSGNFLKSEKLPPDNTPRIVVLKIFNSAGDENEVLTELKLSRGPNSPPWKITISRKRFFEIIGRIEKEEQLVRDIIKNWRREMIHFLNGATEPLNCGFPDPKLLQLLCNPENDDEAATILSILSTEIEAQIIALKASPKDLEGLGLIAREYRIS